jgi:hypothetical protein
MRYCEMPVLRCCRGCPTARTPTQVGPAGNSRCGACPLVSRRRGPGSRQAGAARDMSRRPRCQRPGHPGPCSPARTPERPASPTRSAARARAASPVSATLAVAAHVSHRPGAWQAVMRPLTAIHTARTLAPPAQHPPALWRLLLRPWPPQTAPAAQTCHRPRPACSLWRAPPAAAAITHASAAAAVASRADTAKSVAPARGTLPGWFRVAAADRLTDAAQSSQCCL